MLHFYFHYAVASVCEIVLDSRSEICARNRCSFLGACIELSIYLAFFTVYTSSMFASMAMATGIIWVIRTGIEFAYYLGGRAPKTKKID